MARSAPDYYELLGVPRDAGTTTITRAYRRLANRVHPDAGGTAGLFRLVQDAYEILSDPAARRAYDGAAPATSTFNATPPHSEPEPAHDHFEGSREAMACRVESVEFSGVWLRPGYEEWEVDDFLDRVVATLRGTATDPVSASEVRSIEFSSTRPGPAYDTLDVDTFLDEIEQFLSKI